MPYLLIISMNSSSLVLSGSPMTKDDSNEFTENYAAILDYEAIIELSCIPTRNVTKLRSGC